MMHARFQFLSVDFLMCWLLIGINASSAQTARGTAADSSKPTKPLTKVPNGVILVKGAWSASSDSLIAVPENGAISDGVYRNKYFGLNYTLPNGWAETYDGPPPSDSGHYVLAQIQQVTTRAQLLISAQDMFFSDAPAHNALQWAAYEKDNLQPDYKLEIPVTQTKIAAHPFSFFAYWSPAAQLHWYVLGTEMRCHTLEFVFTGREAQSLNSLAMQMRENLLTHNADSTTGGRFPICIKNYAEGQQLIRRVEPIFTEYKFNSVPVRIIIDAHGTIKHIHFLSAFPGQQKAITDALKQWKFKPYLDHGKAVEVETGVIFGGGETGRTERSTVN